MSRATGAEDIESAIAALGEGTPEYHDALAMYFIVLSRAQWRKADQARKIQMDRERRKERTRP